MSVEKKEKLMSPFTPLSISILKNVFIFIFYFFVFFFTNRDKGPGPDKGIQWGRVEGRQPR